jgi:hypothetical protein
MPRGKPGVQIMVDDRQWVAGTIVLPKACSEVTKARLRRAVKRGFDESQQRVHVVTGALKASGHIVEHEEGLNLEMEVIYGGEPSEVDYAGYEESYHPFLQPAMLEALAGFTVTTGGEELGDAQGLPAIQGGET